MENEKKELVIEGSAYERDDDRLLSYYMHHLR
jgi:hypothetical protein